MDEIHTFDRLIKLPSTIAKSLMGRLIVVGYTVLFVTALPKSLEHGAGIGGLVATMVLTGLGQGGLSAVMYPFIGKRNLCIHANTLKCRSFKH
jgi:hypothetical protein